MTAHDITRILIVCMCLVFTQGSPAQHLESYSYDFPRDDSYGCSLKKYYINKSTIMYIQLYSGGNAVEEITLYYTKSTVNAKYSNMRGVGIPSYMDFLNDIRNFVLGSLTVMQLEKLANMRTGILIGIHLNKQGNFLNICIRLEKSVFDKYFSGKQIYNMLNDIMTKFKYEPFAKSTGDFEDENIWFPITKKDIKQELNSRRSFNACFSPPAPQFSTPALFIISSHLPAFRYISGIYPSICQTSVFHPIFLQNKAECRNFAVENRQQYLKPINYFI